MRLTVTEEFNYVVSAVQNMINKYSIPREEYAEWFDDIQNLESVEEQIFELRKVYADMKAYITLSRPMESVLMTFVRLEGKRDLVIMQDMYTSEVLNIQLQPKN